MTIRTTKHRSHRPLSLEWLEQRQLLAVASYGGNVPQDSVGTELRIPWQARPDSYEFTQPAHGELQWNDGQTELIYKPDDGFIGADSFTYAADGIQPQEFSLRVWETVFAVTDWQSATNDVPSRLDVLANDYIFTDNYLNLDKGVPFPTWVPENGATTIVDVRGAHHGQVRIAEDGRSLQYEAAPHFIGSDTVTYTVEDTLGHHSTAEVTIHVTAEPREGKHFVAEAEFLQSQVDAWMRRFGGALTNHVVSPYTFWPPTTEFDPLIFFNLSISDVQGNDQVSGVQEGDIVRTDGEFLYVVTHSQTPDRFQSFLSIVDVRQPSTPKVLSTTGFEDQVEDIFLADNGRIAVVSSNDGFHRAGVGGTPLVLDWPFWPTERDFTVHVLDVSEPSIPQTVSETTIDGEYRESRVIDGFLYTIGSQHGQTLPAPHELIDETAEPTSPAIYLEALLARETAAFLPGVTISAGDAERSQPLLEWSDVIRTDVNWDDATFISTIDLHGSSGVPVDVEAVAVGGFSTVYVSNQAIYLLDGQQVVKMGFEADGAGVDLVAAGALQGRALNPFSVDEYEGRLRITTTSDWDGRVDVHVLEQHGESLEIVGSVSDIAPGETIYATRFEGDKAFVVTFRTVDPLFVIDLSDPTQPTIAGELKVPGYSNYLQMIGENLLLGIGRNADEETGLYEALQVSLFDVEDPQNPVLIDRYLFDGGRSTWSPLADSPWQLTDHQAVSFDPATGLLTLPINSNGGWEWADDPLFVGQNSAVSVFRLSSQGIEEVGQVAFNDRALRSVFLEDHVLYLSGEALQVATLEQPTTVIGALGLPLDGHTSAGIYDMNGDGVTSPLDALLLINAAQDVGFGSMDSVTSAMIQADQPQMATKLDVNRDGAFSPLDALMVVNQLPSSTPPQAARSVVVSVWPDEESTSNARASDEIWVPFDALGFRRGR